MEDERIVLLYWDRDEAAISESSMKYGAYCTSIAQNILKNPADAEECVNDTWLHAWNAMPPHRPSLLSTFLGKITRNLSFDLYRKMHRGKRGGSQVDAVLDELEECVSGKDNIERQWEMKELVAEINQFLQKLPEEKRCMFVLRYWYVDSIGEIAGRRRESRAVSLHSVGHRRDGDEMIRLIIIGLALLQEAAEKHRAEYHQKISADDDHYDRDEKHKYRAQRLCYHNGGNICADEQNCAAGR